SVTNSTPRWPCWRAPRHRGRVLLARALSARHRPDDPNRHMATQSGPVESAPDRAREAVREVRLLDERRLRLRGPEPARRIRRIARHEEHLQIWVHGDETLGELVSAHVRHDDVREKQIDLASEEIGRAHV